MPHDGRVLGYPIFSVHSRQAMPKVHVPQFSLTMGVAFAAITCAAAPVALAQADPSTVGVGCSDAGFYVETVTAQPGDTVTLEGNGGPGTTCTLSLNGVATASNTSFRGDESVVLTILGTGTIEVSTSLPPASSPTLTVVSPPTGASTQADIVQQVPLPASESCNDVADSAFRYGTAVTGGWQLSWAYWADHGAGGPICTRTLHHDQSINQWTVL